MRIRLKAKSFRNGGVMPAGTVLNVKDDEFDENVMERVADNTPDLPVPPPVPPILPGVSAPPAMQVARPTNELEVEAQRRAAEARAGASGLPAYDPNKVPSPPHIPPAPPAHVDTKPLAAPAKSPDKK